MSSRLPIPGSDGNNWGGILNDYLQQSLASDGTLVTGATNSYTGLANTNLASNTQPGLVQLTTDLGGSAASPSVVAIQGQSVSASSPSDGDVLTWSATGNNWSAQPAPAGGSGYSGDLDGGNSTSSYAGTTTIDGGNSA